MKILLSLLFLAALAGVIVRINARGWMRHTGCTCRTDKTCAGHDEHP